MRARIRKHPSRVAAATASALALAAFGWLATASAEDAKPAAPAPSVTTAAPSQTAPASSAQAKSTTTQTDSAPAKSTTTQTAPAPSAPAKSTTTQTTTQAKPASSAPVQAKVPAAQPTKVVPNQASAPPATTPVVPAVPVQKVKVVPPGPTKTTGITKQQPVAGHPAAPAQGKTSTTAPTGPTAGKAAPGIQPTAQLDEQMTYQYNALGRRDPFMPLVGGEWVGADVGGDAPPDVGGIKVVGIVWGDADKFALVEDARGESHVLRRGDKVMNGFVESLSREGIVVSLTADGQTQSVSIPLTRKGDKNGAAR
jgi:hypothetical protein